MIIVDKLNRYYGEFQAVKDVSFKIEKGEIVGLLGHNGAGKTTIMKMLTGFLEASSGKIEIDGLNIEESRLAIQEKIGYLPENDPLYPELTILDYLDYVADLRGLSAAQKSVNIQRAIQQTALKEKARDKIETLSKGYKQRVGVAQAILHQPQILILDEPTNGLDPKQIQEMRNLIKKLAENATVILSTHIMQEVEAVCSRVLMLQRGSLALDSQLSDIRTTDRIVLKIDRGEKDFLAQLKSFPVKEAELISARGAIYHYSLRSSSSAADVIPDITKTAVGLGWKIYEISAEERNLETVFRQINS